AGPELFRAVENTITEYQENVSPSKEENDCVKRLLDIILLPEIQLHRAEPGEEDSSELASDYKPISAVNPACSAAQGENMSRDWKESEGPLSALKTRKSKRMQTEKGQSSLISSKGRKSVLDSVLQPATQPDLPLSHTPSRTINLQD
ncbi:unnamed protein product, partial [Coregonus sp. 'balchen']